MLIIADILSTRLIPRFFKEELPNKVYSIIKYCGLLFLPIYFAVFIRTFFFDVYFVPSSSMERTLFPNDYVLVNKVSYGTKIPKRIQDIPVIGNLFKKKYKQHQYDLYSPLKSFKNFKREDIVVFKSVENNAKFLIKRIIGLPADTLKIIDAKVFINRTQLKDKDLFCYNYIDYTENGIKLIKTFSNKEFEKLKNKNKTLLYKDIEKEYSKRTTLFPYPLAKEKKWTRDNYGELIVPKKGMRILLNKNNFKIYKSILTNFENQKLEVLNDETKAYIFKNNYYFMMGDNRHGSRDSRFFGFVPESYIQGKMIKAFSKNRLLN